MKRLYLLAVISVIIASCAGPNPAQAPTWTPEAPKKINVTIELPTAHLYSTAATANEYAAAKSREL